MVLSKSGSAAVTSLCKSGRRTRPLRCQFLTTKNYVSARYALSFASQVFPVQSSKQIDRFDRFNRIYAILAKTSLTIPSPSHARGSTSIWVVDSIKPEAMRQYAIQQGMPDKDIVLDYAGRRTYDTCYRAEHIFGVQDAILVTQWFHLDR